MISAQIIRKIFLTSGIVLVLASACSIAPQTTPAVENNQNASPPATTNSKDFSAQLNSNGQAILTWKPITGVDSYQLELQIGGDEYIPLASLPADQTTFTDRNIPADTSLTYRLDGVTKSKTGETRITTLATPTEKVNPLKITVDFDKTPAAVDPKNLDPKTFDPSKIDPNNFDTSMFMPQPLLTRAVIGPKGGEITVTGINTVVYTLTIPADSLSFDTPITLKPISTIPDLPLSAGLIGAVFIEPQEVVFHIPAALTITPPKNSPGTQGSLKAGFAFDTDGQEFHLYPTGQNALANTNPHTARLANNPSFEETPKDKLEVSYGGGYGTGNGTPQDIQTITASNPTNTIDSTTQQLAAAQLGVDDLAPLPNIPKESVSLAKTGEQIFQQATKANDWDKFMETLDKLTNYLHSDGEKYNKSLNGKIIASLLEKANVLLKKNKSDCLSEDDLKAQELLERLVNPKTDFEKSFSAEYKKKFDAKLLNDLYNGFKACTYQVQMKSNLSYDVEGSTLFTSMETQKIPLFFTYLKGQVFFFGSSPMKLSTSVSGTCSFPVEHYDGLTLVFQKLRALFDKGKLNDFAVEHLFVDGWTGGAGISASGDVCPTMVKLTGGGDYWTGLFTIARASLKNEMMLGWKIQQGDFSKGTTLKANWQSVVRSFPPMGSSGEMSEDTKLDLTITPNKK